MALIKCKECGNMISDKAKACPKCGCPLDAYSDPQPQENNDYIPDYYPEDNHKKRNRYIIIALIVVVILGGVGYLLFGVGKKVTPEEQVRSYAKYFIEKVSLNQIDSLKETYPDISMADSLVQIKSDSILVRELTPGRFEATLAPKVKIEVNRNEDGKINVVHSYGLFAYPSKQQEIALQTGLYKDSLNDIEITTRMKDKEFFDYIEKKNKKLTASILKKGKPGHFDGRYIYNYVTNLTDQPIKGSDYSVTFKDSWWSFALAVEYGDDNGGITKYAVRQGKDIPPHGTVTFKREWEGDNWNGDIQKIELKIPEEELLKRFAPFKGNEYKEYLDSKK